MRRWLCTTIPVLALLAGAASAGSFPERPITILCGFTPGAAADVPLRALALAASRELGQTVIVENRPGAAGTLAAAALASAKSDGYTLAQVTNTVVRQPFIAKTAYDPMKDFTYVIGVSSFDFGLVVNANSPWKTFDEFVEYARKHPGKVSYGSIGNGSVPHQVMNKVGAKLGLDWTHVPYKGSSPAQTDLQGGALDALSDTTGWVPFVDAGKFRLLAVYGETRLKRYPNVPTLKELGLAISDDAPWGIAAPKGVPPERIKRIHDAFKKAMSDETFLRALGLLAGEARYRTTAQYESYMAARAPYEKDVVEKYGLRNP